MSRKQISSDLRAKACVIGTVHSIADLPVARRLQTGDLDFLEIRADHFAADPAPVLSTLPRLRVPLIVTVRHPAEGGAAYLTPAQRRALFLKFLPFASFIDLELRFWTQMQEVVEAAQQAGVKAIASAHNFRLTPSGTALQETIRRAHRAGADVCKLAACADTPAALGRLLSTLSRPQPLPISVMGMGKFGKISRPLFAQAGSVLNYGYLARPNASGQWPARLLKQRIAELVSD